MSMNMKKVSLLTAALMMTLLSSCADDGEMTPTTTSVCKNMQIQCSASGVPQKCELGQWVDKAACINGEVCDDGRCVSKANCANGSQRCDNNGVPQRCVNGNWENQPVCLAGKVCVGGNCISNGECSDNDTQCDSNGIPQKCLGGKWVNQAPCNASQKCSGGSCVSTGSSECTENNVQCDSNGIPQKCLGGKWVNQALCGAGQVCNGGYCENNAVIGKCTENDVQCDENGVPQKCIDGDWKNQTLCDATHECVKGNCEPKFECADNDKLCQDDVPLHCVNGFWEPQTKCSADQICTKGDCEDIPATPECTPNSVQCVGSLFQTCNAKGFWTDTETCSVYELCDDNAGCVCSSDRCSLLPKYLGDVCVQKTEKDSICGCNTDADCSAESQTGRYVCQNNTCVVVCDNDKCGVKGSCLYPDDPSKITDCGCDPDPKKNISCKEGFACNVKDGGWFSKDSYICQKDCSKVPDKEYWGDVLDKNNQCVAGDSGSCKRSGYVYNAHSKKCAKEGVKQLRLVLTDTTCDAVMANTSNQSVKACETLSTLTKKGLKIFFTNSDIVELVIKNNKLDFVNYYKTVDAVETHKIKFTPSQKNIKVKLGEDYYTKSDAVVGKAITLDPVEVATTVDDPSFTIFSADISIDYDHMDTGTLEALTVTIAQ